MCIFLPVNICCQDMAAAKDSRARMVPQCFKCWFHVLGKSMVITMPADALAPDGARPSADMVLIIMFHMIILVVFNTFLLIRMNN